MRRDMCQVPDEQSDNKYQKDEKKSKCHWVSVVMENFMEVVRPGEDH